MKFKRFMGLVLAVIMVMSTFTVGSFAATYRDQVTKRTETYYGTPTIDAQLDDVWENAVAVDFPYDRQNASETSIAEPLATPLNHWAKTLWDDEGFYVYFRVYDANVYMTTVASDVYLWDSVEIYFDEYNEKASTAGSMIFPCIAPTTDGNGLCNKPQHNCEFKTKINADEGYYDIEVKVPFTKISPANDVVIGFDVAINENDSNTDTRKSSFSWNDRTNKSYQKNKYLGETVLKGKEGGGSAATRPEGATDLHSDGSLWYNIVDDVLTIGGTARQFNFSGNLPWYWNETITKLVIEAPLTSLPAGAFKTMRTLKTVVMPESVTSFPGGGVFDGCWALDTIALSEDTIEDGVMDLTKITSMASWALGGIGERTEAITVLFGDDMDFSGYNAAQFFQPCPAITVKVNEDTTAATTFAAFKETASNSAAITLELLEADDEGSEVPPVERPEGAIDLYEDGTLWYAIDNDVLTVGGTATDFIFSGNLPWYWNETITKLVISAPLESLPAGAFKTMRVLKTVVMPESVTSFAGGGVFDGCWALDTIALSEDAIEDGVMDLTKLTSMASWALGGIGANAEAVTVLFGDDMDFSGYNGGQFLQACPAITVKVNEDTTAATTFAAFKETASNSAAITLVLLEGGAGGEGGGDEGGEGDEEPPVIRPADAINLHDDGTLWYTIRENVLTIGGTATDFMFSGNLPWYWNETITKLVVEAPLEAIPTGAFKTMRVLETVVMPESVTYLGGGVFDGCWVLDTLALSEDAIEEGVMDLTKITSMASYALGGIGANAEAITVLFADDMDFSGCNAGQFFQACPSVTVRLNVGTTAATTFVAFEENATNKDNISIEWVIDGVVRPADAIDLHTDGTLWYTIRENVLTIGGPATEFRFSGNLPWYWNETITKLVIEAPLAAIPTGAFKTMRVLKTVVMPESVTYLGGGVFDGCYVLDTIALSEDAIKEGVMDLTKITSMASYALGGIGKDAEAVTVLFADDMDFSGYNGGQFFQACPSVTVKVKKDTTAATTFAAFKETAANKDNITLEIISSIIGDIDGDGEIAIADAVLFAQSLAKWAVEINEDAADTNGDGEIGIADLVLLAQYLAKWEVELG